MKHTAETIHEYTMGQFHIDILWVEFEGGGAGYEYLIDVSGETVTQSSNGYGMPAAAARDAFNWIVENAS